MELQTIQLLNKRTHYYINKNKSNKPVKMYMYFVFRCAMMPGVKTLTFHNYYRTFRVDVIELAMGNREKPQEQRPSPDVCLCILNYPGQV